MDPLDVELIVPLSDGVTVHSRDGAVEKEGLEHVEEVVAVEEPEVNEGEEEWPSLGLDLEVEAEALDVEEERVEMDSAASEEEEEEWPSIRSIPGLETLESEPSSEKFKSRSSSRSVAEDFSDSSSLGELRFQDE